MPKKIDPKVEGLVLGLSEAGMSVRKIESELKKLGIVISKDAVHRIIRNIGKHREAKSQGLPAYKRKYPRPKWTTEVVNKIRKWTAMENPLSLRSMAAKAKISVRTVRRIIESFNFKVRKKSVNKVSI